MRRLWQIVLPTLGLLFFAMESYQSIQMNREAHTTRYKYWSAIKLDTDPLERDEPKFVPCRDDATMDCSGFGPKVLWVEAGVFTKGLLVSALPAFLVGAGLVRGLAHFGVNQVITFALSMPVLIAAWFFLLGRFIDGLSFSRR
jgi:hypothetical protein